MPKIETFTRRSLEGIADNKDAERDQKRAYKLYEHERIVPETLRQQANVMLAERADTLAFNTGRPVAECQLEMLRRFPYLALGVRGYMADKEFRNVAFVEEESNDDAT